MNKIINVRGTPGVIYDVPAHALQDNAFSDANNAKFSEVGASSLQGDLAALSTATIVPTWMQAFPPIGNPRWVYGNATEMHVVEGSTHTEITRLSGDYTGSASERWQATVLNGVGIFNNTIDLPQAWTSFDPATRLVDLPNWNTNLRAKSIRAFKNYLVALYITDTGVERPYRILWSDSADTGTLPGSWDTSDPATDANEFDLAETSDYLVDSYPLGDVNIIYKETSTWGMAFIGPRNYFRFFKILSGRGLLARDCMVSTPFGHVVATLDDIIIHQGQKEQADSILTNKLRKWLFTRIDPTNYRNSFMFMDLKNNEVYFCFPEIDQTYASKAVIWNWEEGSIGVRDITPTPFASVGPIGSSIDEDLEWG